MTDVRVAGWWTANECASLRHGSGAERPELGYPPPPRPALLRLFTHSAAKLQQPAFGHCMHSSTSMYVCTCVLEYVRTRMYV